MPLDRMLGLGALGLAAVLGVTSWRFGLGTFLAPGPGFWPFLVTCCIAGLGGALVLCPDPAFRARSSQGSRWKSLGMALATLGFFVAALEPLGYPVTTTALLLVQFRWVEGRSWRIAWLLALSAALLSFSLFRFFLHVPLPAGIVPLPRGW